MILEIIIVAAVAFFICVLFYKQANEEFQILQIDYERLQELPTLYQDRSPIVVSQFPTPSLGTDQELQKRPQLLRMRITPTESLGMILTNPQRLSTFPFPQATAEWLARESGLQIWFQQSLYEASLPSPYTSWIYSAKTSLWPHHRGLFQTTAFQTILMPTQGEVSVNLLMQKMIPYLPKSWKGRVFSSLSPQDTPLLQQIQYLEVKLRKGNLLFLPAHMIVDVHTTSQDEPAWIFQADLHHPISRLNT